MRRAKVVMLLLSPLALIALVSSAACSSHPKIAPGKNFAIRPLATKTDAGVDPSAGEPSSVPSYLVGSLGKSDGPHLARAAGGGGAAMVAWIASDGTARRLFTVPLTPEGEPRSEARAVATAPLETPTFVLRGSSDRSLSAGYFAGWGSILDRGETLSVVALGIDGNPRGPVVDLARTNDHVVWFEIVPTARGGIVVWAEETRTGDANVLAVAIDADGKQRGVPSRIGRGVTGWQAIAATDGAGVALVSPLDKAKAAAAPTSGRNDDDKEHDRERARARERQAAAKAGTLSWVRLDADARPIGAPSAIASKATVTGDIDVVSAGTAYVFAWTDRSREDPEVEIAAVDDAGKVQPPRPAMQAIGGGTLAAIVSGKQGIVLAWDEPAKRPKSSRRVHLSKVTMAGALGANELSAIEAQGRAGVELVATDAGYAMLFAAQTCAGGSPDERCPAPVMAPTFLRFDDKLAATETQPLRLGDEHVVAALAWGLACAGERCLALTASSANPTPVSAVNLAPRVTPYRAPAVAARPPNAPRLTGLETLSGGEPYADLAVTKLGDGAALALITSAVDEHEQRDASGGERSKRPKDATVTVRTYDVNGVMKGASFVVTHRALTAGGVAIAAAGRPEDGAAVAWVARDGGDPQVHVTKLNAAGRRTNEVQVTSSKGDAADVSIAWAGDGWLLSWVDARDGNGEVYATKLDKDLNRTAKEERITNAPGDAGDVTLVVQGDHAWLAWSDPRESPKDGFSDVYVTTLGTKDARRASDEVRVLATAAHSRSPSLALANDVPIVAWIEEAPLGLDTASMGAYGAMLAKLDPRGRPLKEPTRAPLAGEGIATGITLTSAGRGVHAFLARSTREEVVVDAFDASLEPGVRAYSLLSIDGPPSIEVALGTLGDWLFYDDEGAAPGDRRVRRATLLWRR
jgi:hypothetical protein